VPKCAVRERRETGKCEGRKSPRQRHPEIVALAKRYIGAESERAAMSRGDRAGWQHKLLNRERRPFAAASLRSMIEEGKR